MIDFLYHQPDRTYIRTYTGRKFYPLEPRPGDVDIYDIAHALAQNCRYTGHTRWHYSVAQHSMYVAEMLPREFKLWGLLHDASEAYMSDIARPIKQTAVFAEYRLAEKRLERAIAFRFGLTLMEPPQVKVVDGRMLATEIKQLMHGYEDDTPYSDAYKFPITRMSPDEAEARFLQTFARLWDGRAYRFAD